MARIEGHWAVRSRSASAMGPQPGCPRLGRQRAARPSGGNIAHGRLRDLAIALILRALMVPPARKARGISVSAPTRIALSDE